MENEDEEAQEAFMYYLNSVCDMHLKNIFHLSIFAPFFSAAFCVLGMNVIKSH